MDLENALNSQQLKALKEINGAVMVLAGAGSGKTRLITYRIAYLINDLNVDPENILAITFTNKAANEMKERLEKLLGNKSRGIWISTFHSMCVKILRKHLSSLNTPQTNFNSNFSIYTDTEKDRAIKKVLEDMGETKDITNKMSFYISNAKNNNLSPWQYQKLNSNNPDIDKITRVYSAYQNFLASNNALDFDDLLTKTYELFLNFPDILKRYQNRFEYIHIDEFQDTNSVQYKIASLLAGEHKNIFVVGDEDQCIYSWRGANVNNIRDFERDFKDYKLFKLEQNYRSTKEILLVANKLIKNNQYRNDKSLWTENMVGEREPTYKAYDELDEADYVALKIKSLVNEGYKYSDIAVLCRLNASFAPFEDKFLSYNIPYKLFGGNKFFDRVEIKNILSYLKLITNPYDTTSFSRIVNYPKRKIGEASINTILSLSTFHNTTPYNLILNSEEYLLGEALEKKIKPFKDFIIKLNEYYKTLSPYDFIVKLIELIDFKSIYSTSLEEDLSRLLNVDNFVVMAQNYFKNNPKSTISEYLQSMTLISDIDGYNDDDNNVVLATVHSVKGLEFKVVFVVALEEKIFPIIRSMSTSNDIEEERRIMFVAVTRAKEKLFLSYARSRFMYGKRDYSLPSRFLYEVEELENKIVNSVNISTPFVEEKRKFSLPKTFETSKEKKQNENLEKIYKVGTVVSHTKFGRGVIESNFGIAVTKCVRINFDSVGVKTLSVEYAPITVVKEGG